MKLLILIPFLGLIWLFSSKDEQPRKLIAPAPAVPETSSLEITRNTSSPIPGIEAISASLEELDLKAIKGELKLLEQNVLSRDLIEKANAGVLGPEDKTLLTLYMRKKALLSRRLFELRLAQFEEEFHD